MHDACMLLSSIAIIRDFYEFIKSLGILDKKAKENGWAQLGPRYNGTLIPTGATFIRQ